MRLRLGSLLLAAVFAVAPVAASTTSAPPHMDAAARPALVVVEAFSAALQAGDLKRVEAMLDPTLLVLESGGAERSRAEYLAGHAGADAKFLKDAKVTVKNRHARADGDLAWIGTESELVTAGDKPRTYLSTETMVLRRSAGTWRIVHIHWSSRPKGD